MNKLREQKEYEGNPVGLPQSDAEAIAQELDRHLATFVTLYHQYHKHHWLIEGPQFRDLHLFFEEHYNEIHADYDAIAERLTVMGIAPTCHPANQAELSYVKHEEEGVYHIREMLHHDMAAEKQIAVELRKSIKDIVSRGDFATETLLKGVLLRTEDRAHHIEHFLGEDSLSVGLLHKAEDMMEDEEKEKLLEG